MFERIKNIFFNNKPRLNRHSDRSILVVEDNEIDRSIIERALARAGYTVRLAANGAEGLESVKTHRPDLILLDYEMPIMGGVEMCRLIKENDITKNIPIVFLTSADNPKNIVECFELDAENYLNKPVKPKLLISEIDAILSEHTTT